MAALFLAPSADLEYLTGVARQIPNFGEASYAHGFGDGRVLPARRRSRVRSAADVRRLRSARAARGRARRRQRDRRRRGDLRAGRRGLGRGDGAVALGDRVWAETTSSSAQSSAPAGFAPVAARQRAAPGQVARGARRARARDRDGRGGDGGRRAARRPGRLDGRARRGRRAPLRAAGSRCPSFTTHIFTGLGEDDFDSGEASAREPITEGLR